MSANDRFLIVLEGQGDVYVVLCTREYFDWINLEGTPGRKGHESSWDDTAAPQPLKDAFIKSEDWGDDPPPEGPGVTVGSLDNDRALHVCAFADELPDIESFDSAKEALRHVREKGFVLVDQYNGYIY